MWRFVNAAFLYLGVSAFAAAPLKAGEHQLRRIEITGFGGMQFGGSTLSRLGQFQLAAKPSYGAMLDIRVRPDATVQFLYDRQDTVLDFRDNHPFFPTRVLVDVAVEYYHAGGTVELSDKRLRPYISMTMGATRFAPGREDLSDEWRFSIGFGAGFKTYVTPRFGVRVDGRVWPTFLRTSGGFFCSAPGGCLVSVEADFLTQGNVTGGLFFTF